MQAKLPDINAAIVRYRNNWLHAFDAGDHNAVIISISACIALMPDDYKVEINTEKYYRQIKENKIIICEYCKEEHPHDDIKTIPVRVSPLKLMIYRKPCETIWYCPNCKKPNIYNSRKVRITKFQQPFYLGIIPEPPQRRFGISDRSSFDTKFKNWFEITVCEVESKIGKYRADYIAQMEGDDVQVPDEEHEP